MSHFLLFPDSPEARKAKKKPRIVELVSYASSPEKQGASRRLSPDSDIEMFEDNLTGASGRLSPDSDIEMFEDNLTESTQRKENRDGRLADVFMSGSQPVNALAPPFSTANNRSSDTLPIASDDEPEVSGNRKPWGSETRLGANAYAQNRQAATALSKKLRITSLTQSFSSAKINRDKIPIASNDEYEQAPNGWQGTSQTMRNAKNPTNCADNPIATLSLGSSPMSPTPFRPSAVFQRSFSESASNMDDQQAHAKQETNKMKSALKAKIHATSKPMNTEEKLRYEKLRDMKRKLVSKGPSEAGPSSVTRKNGKYSINTPLPILTVVRRHSRHSSAIDPGTI